MRKFIHLLLISILLFNVTGCFGGRKANPVMKIQMSDTQKSCEILEFEMNNIQSEMTRLLPQKSKLGKNSALAFAVWFLIVPWFFMDFTNAEKTEYKAYQARFSYPYDLSMIKKCSFALNMPNPKNITTPSESA